MCSEQNVKIWWTDYTTAVSREVCIAAKTWSFWSIAGQQALIWTSFCMLCIVCKIASWFPVGSLTIIILLLEHHGVLHVTFLVLVFRNPSLLSVHYWEMLATKNPDVCVLELWETEKDGWYLDTIDRTLRGVKSMWVR